MRKLKKRILAGILCLCMCGTMLPSMMPLSAAADAKSNAIMDLAKTKPEGFDVTSTENPYGYGVDQPFLMSTENELLLYQTNPYKTKNWTTYYDNFQTGAINNKISSGQMNMAINNAGEKGAFSSTGSYDTMPKLSYVQCVAFDPRGTGRKDQIAYVGYYAEYPGIYLWTLNTKTGRQSEPQRIGNAEWIKDSGMTQYQAKNFFAITAGDYIGCGKETVVVYVAGDKGDYCLKDMRATYSNPNSDTFTWHENSSSYGRNLLHSDYRNVTFCQSANMQDKLSVSLDTGDFNGDGIADLAVLSYLNRPTNAHPNQAVLFQPQLRAAFGSRQRDILEANCIEKRIVKPTDNPKIQLTMAAPSVSAGDIDGDGLDEIVVAGYKNEITFDDGGMLTNFGISQDKAQIACYSVENRDTGVYTERCVGDDDLSGFVTGGYWASSDSTWQPLTVACVAINGGTAAEYVFIGGKLYNMGGGAPVVQFTPDYFTRDDKAAGGSTINVTYIQSVAVGNFDGNPTNRQQVAVVIGLKVEGHEWYYYKLGIIGGCQYADERDDKGEIVKYGAAADYYSSDIANNDYVISNQAADDVTNGPLNCNLVAIDNDNDGLLAKYEKKYYAYSDPTVLTVLQAAPYFNELGGFSEFTEGATSYGFTNSYTYGITNEHNSSIGVGMAVDGAAPGIKISIEGGYTVGFTKSFDKSLTTSYGTTFTAGAFDTVVLHRTPVFLYSYTVFNKATGRWEKDKIQVSIPKDPTYFSMSTKDYNDFVGTYNDYADKNNTKPGKKIDKMNRIDDPSLGHEGDPFSYRKTWGGPNNPKQISKTPYALGHNGGSIESNWAQETSGTDSNKMTNQFHFGMTVQGGAMAVAGEAWAGISFALDYGYNYGTYETISQTTASSGTVSQIDSASLLVSQKIPVAVSEQYNFSWTFGRWEYKLGGGNGDKPVPCFGYAVSSLSAPARAITNLTAELITANSAELSWGVSKTPGRLEPLGYNVYLVDKNGYTKLNNTQLSATTTSFEVSELQSNATYTYVVSVIGETGEGIMSNQASVMTPKKNYKVYLPKSTPGVTSILATHQGNIPITSGDPIPEESVVNVAVKLADGYGIESYTLSMPGKDPKIIPAVAGKTEFNFILQADTTISVQTKQIENVVTFTESSYDYGTQNLQGRITATVFDMPLSAPGGLVTGSVKFTALPEEGYILVGWLVFPASGGGAWEAYPAIDNTFTLYPAEDCHVNAFFVLKANAMQTITLANSAHGHVTVTDADGAALTPNEKGEISVLYGTSVTFTATADKFYRFESWGSDLANSPSGAVTKAIRNRMIVSANFFSPIKYGVTFDSGITGYADDVSILSGANVSPGSKMRFTATLPYGQRIKSWNVSGVPQEGEHGNTFEIASLEKSINVTVTFESIDRSAPHGTITIKENGFSTFLNTITFGLFFKETVDVTITAVDQESGVKSIEYQKVPDEASYDENGTWTNYQNKFSVKPNEKFIVYAKLTNGQDMSRYISSGGVILYTDSEQDTAAIQFTKTSSSDVTAKVKLNGNTVKEIKNGATTIDANQYTVAEDGTISFKAAYLDTLAASATPYTLTISYNPLNESFVNEGSNQAPADTEILLTVQKAEQTALVLSALNPSYIYGESLTVSATGGDSTKAVVYSSTNPDVATVDSATGVVTLKAVGSFQLKATKPADDFYNETAITGTIIEVTPKALTVTGLVATDRPYDGTLGVVLTGGQLNGKVGTDDVSVVMPTAGTISDKNVGNGKTVAFQTMTLSGETAGNYTLSQPTLTVNVTAKAISVVPNGNQSKVYGEQDGIIGYTTSNGALESGDTLSGALAREPGETVGSYRINIGTLANANYAITVTNESYGITKKELTVTAENKTKVYGEENPALTFVYNGFENDETAAALSKAPIAACTALKTSATGDYEITVSGAEAANYSFRYVKGTLGITKKELTVTADNKTKVYGEENPALTFVYNGFVNDETAAAVSKAPIAACTASKTSATGDYEITVSGAEAANYSFRYVKGTLGITKKELTVTAENKTKVYGEENPALTVVCDGFVNGETVAALSKAPIAACTASKTSATGDYEITVSGAEAANYSFRYVKGTLGITKKELTVTAENKTKVYGEENPALTVVYDGFVNGETAAALSKAPIAACTALKTSATGDYEITVSGAEAANYSFRYVKGTLSITKKAPVILPPVIEDDSPNASIDSDSQDVLDAVLTDEDKAALNNGAEYELYLKFNKISPTADEKAKIEAALGNMTVGMYLDISLFKKVNGVETKIDEISKKIRVSFDIPADLIKEGRTIAVIRTHGGITEVLQDLDNDPNTFTLETDKFSTYALTYEDPKAPTDPNQDPNTNTGEHFPLLPLCVTGMVSLGVIGMVAKKRKGKVIEK